MFLISFLPKGSEPKAIKDLMEALKPLSYGRCKFALERVKQFSRRQISKFIKFGKSATTTTTFYLVTVVTANSVNVYSINQ